MQVMDERQVILGAGAREGRRAPVVSRGTLARIAVWTFLGTAAVDLLVVGIPLFPGRILTAAPAAMVGLVVVGAGAALPLAGASGWAAALAFTAAAHVILFALAQSFADVMQGNTAAMPRAEYGLFVFAALLGAILALAVGYWGLTAIRGRMAHDPGRPNSSERRRVRVPAVALSTGLALVFAGVMATWAAGSSLVLDETATTVHRVTITGTTITVDADVIKAGEVTWLASVSGSPPYDLTLVDVSGRTSNVMGTPPDGSVDFLLARMTLTPGDWYFTAGLEKAVAGGAGAASGTDPRLPIGPLVARFQVVP
jgi:hypothetical protein